MRAEPRVVHDADGIVVLDKPSGWNVHPVGTDAPDVLAWATATGLGELRPVHRLDLGTSGALVLARTAEVARALGEAFATRDVDKTYHAVVIGRTRAKGIVRRSLKDRGHSHPAVTRWRRLEALGGFTLLELQPETGRTHQIRRHLQGIGHPVVGDARYGPRRFVPVPGYPGRLWLHAARVTLLDGLDVAVGLPPALQVHLEELRAGARDAG